MKNPLELTPPDATYIERSAAMNREALEAEFASITRDYKKFSEAMLNVEENSLTSINAARALGIRLQTASGHEHVQEDFWKLHCAGKLPFDFASAKMFVSIAKKMPEPATNIRDAIPFVQLALVANGTLELEERAESQRAIGVSKLENFFLKLSIAWQPFSKAVAEHPMEHWEPSALRKFLSETERLASEREKAEMLLKSK